MLILHDVHVCNATDREIFLGNVCAPRAFSPGQQATAARRRDLPTGSGRTDTPTRRPPCLECIGVEVGWAPGSAEPIHSHPNDLLTIQLTPGKLGVTIGTEHQTQERPGGYVHFLPRNLQHSYASEDTKPFELLSIAIK